MKITSRFATILLSAMFVFASVSSFAQQKKIKLVVDAGHGGHDSGATISDNDNKEKDLVLEIAQFMQKHTSDIEIILTRDSDEFVQLMDRAQKIDDQQADLAISLHINNNPMNEKMKGVQVYTMRDTDDIVTLKFSQLLYQNLTEKTKLEKNKKEEAGFVILNKTKTPIVLIEIGFISNQEDLEYISSPIGKREISMAIIQAVREMKEFL